MFKLERLEKRHNRKGFDCGSEPLNQYLAQTARQHTERGISRTYVLVEDFAPERIIAYFTLNLCQLRAEELPPQYAGSLPRQVPGIKLGRLAVIKERQKQGIGEILLVSAMKMVLEVFETAGGIGLFVDAKDEKAKDYYVRFGFVPFPSNPMQLFLPLESIRQAQSQAVPKPPEA